MAHLSFGTYELLDALIKKVSQKAGIVLDRKELLDLCKTEELSKTLELNTVSPCRLEASVFENLYYLLLEKLGLKRKDEDYNLVSSSINAFKNTSYENLSNEILLKFSKDLSHVAVDYPSYFDIFLV